jgi:multidrug efflux pump subunit AcrA (membrane-fusion protein)
MSSRLGFAIIRWLVILAAVVALAVGSWLGYQRWNSTTVTVTKVVSGPVVQAFYATGSLQPEREYPIKSNVEGIVTEVLVDKGDAVTKGQKLAVVVSEDNVLKHRQAEADLELKQELAKLDTSPVLAEFDAKIRAAQEQYDVAMREYRRISKLRETQTSTQTEFDNASERVELMRTLIDSNKALRNARKLELERDVKVAVAALEIAEWNLDQQTLTSPIDGHVLDRPVSVGTRVAVNGHLMQIANVSPEQLVMRANVDEEDKTRVSLNQRVKLTLYAYDERVFEGSVRRIYPQADSDRRTFEIDVAIEPTDPKFSAGMTGELAFIVAEKPVALVVPSQAVQKDRVWVVREGRAEPVEVKTGLRSIERVEIVSGLAEGDEIIISSALELKAGQSVQTKFLDPAEAAGLNTPPPEQAVQGGIDKL